MELPVSNRKEARENHPLRIEEEEEWQEKNQEKSSRFSETPELFSLPDRNRISVPFFNKM